ncbi:hypothetical protein [Archangium lansingense]|uniref:Uncharacterized protein n=1 Tax=Archangium lansingense TaxID=2995310 RepID=A0ABT4A820_9BACT|nr:hypothetical protein [Archangium lansinium]MCY1077404.1 hypothetical protein [Archangium lansinium]
MNAIRWLSEQAARAGSPLTPEAMSRASRAAREAAGPDALAQREQARREHGEQTELELKKLRAVLRSLRGIEREEQHVLRPRSLYETVSQAELGLPDGAHWARLADLERAAEAFSEGVRASRSQPLAAKRGRGERASGDERAADNRYLSAYFASAVGRAGTPRDLAITEIALGRGAGCVDASEFDERRKRWSKAIRRPK